MVLFQFEIVARHIDKIMVYGLLRVIWNKTTALMVFKGTFFPQIQLAD